MKIQRRAFIRKSSLIGIVGMVYSKNILIKQNYLAKGKRVGIIGLDTSHCIAFTKELNNYSVGSEFLDYRVVAAYPYGSRKIKSSVERIPEYIEEIKKYGVEIVESIDELLDKVDVVLLETNDGRLHLSQALQVLKKGKRMFIDKPVAASLDDAIKIYDASKKYNVPVFSASSLRYINGANEIVQGKIGKVLGADTYSPAIIEESHPDLFWYGIHGVEILFTIMGTGCKQVTRVKTENTDVVVGTWYDGRIGTFRGIREGKRGFGGTVYGEKEIRYLNGFPGYKTLLLKIVDFFETGIPPVIAKETLEIIAFMEAAEESINNNSFTVQLKHLSSVNK